MFKWKKLGRVFDPSDVKNKIWLKEFAQAPSALVFDSFVRVYFSCRPNRDKNGQYVSYAAYVDLRKDNLMEILDFAQRPVLELGNTGAFDEFGTYPISVVRYQDEVRAYFGGWTRCESVPFNVAIGVATSKDEGATFAKLGVGPVLSYCPDEPFVISGPKIRRFNDRWFLWYIAGRRWIPHRTNVDNVEYKAEPVYRIRMAVSSDGYEWTRVGRDLIETKIESDEAQASPDVISYKNRFHMFFCYRHSLNYRRNERGYRIGYAYSDDMYHWIRDDAMAGIDISQEGWDNESVSYPQGFEEDGNLYM